jgi:hypothetical protein
LRNQINAVKAIAQGTGKIGKIYGHLLYANNDADLITFFKDANNRIDVAFITRESTDSQDRGPNNNYDLHTLALAWYRSVTRTSDDATNSEDAFQDDVEAVRAIFNANRKLNTGTTQNPVHNSPWCSSMSARMVGYVTFCGVLCHYAELIIVPSDGPNSTTSV